MGLTIHYELNAPDGWDADAARSAVKKLRTFAVSLGCEDCGKVIRWDCRKDEPDLGRFREFLVCYDQTPGAERFLSVPPLDFTMFGLRQGGSETAFFGLGRFGATATDFADETIRRPTNLQGYCWSAFCKTQYASATQCGGWDNFFKIHDGICQVLDFAGTLGIKTVVRDECDYWQHRDAKALQATIAHWNQLIAAFTGKFKDAMQNKAKGAILAPITEDPVYEHLEAQGQHLLNEPWQIRAVKNPKRD